MVQLFKEKGDINCSCCRAMELNKGGFMIEMVLQRTFTKIVSVNAMQFDFIPEKRAFDGMFIIKHLQVS